MCGIFGARWSWLAARHGDPTAAARAALQALRWRGPDAAALQRAGDFVLGCARLTIGAPRSHQPLSLRGGRFVGVLNGAITNARALWQELRPRVAVRRALPNDAWLPLLLAARGAAARGGAAEPSGHHAAAVVDAATDTLWLWRDEAGEKPLFVALADGRPVAFASTLPALAALGVDAGPGAAAAAQWFRFGFDAAPLAVAGDEGLEVVALAAGCHVALGGGPLARQVAPLATTVPATPPAIDRALANAVQRCVDVDAPVALSLSGGVDSSCIAAELAALGRTLPAYQFLAAGERGDERAVAVAVAAHCGLDLRAVDGGPEVLDALPLLTRHWGLPLGDPSVLAVHALAQAAARDGVRVLLSGEGADEALLGYARHRALRRLPPFRLPLPTAVLPRWSMRHAARSLRALAAAEPYAELLAAVPPAFASVVPSAMARGSLPTATWPGRRRDRLERARGVDAAFYLRHDLLPKLDVATMAAAIEGRCPFLDGEVRRAAAALPAAVVLGKAPLRQAYARRLPTAVMAQQKRGFALPLDRWFRGELPWLDLLRQPRTRQRPHLHAPALDAMIDRHRRGADLGRALYLVVAYELWLRAREEACA